MTTMTNRMFKISSDFTEVIYDNNFYNIDSYGLTLVSLQIFTKYSGQFNKYFYAKLTTVTSKLGCFIHSSKTWKACDIMPSHKYP